MKCPICDEETREGQRYCTNCGRDLTKPVTWHCPNCFGDVTDYDREGMAYCPHCGQPTHDNFLADDEVPPKRTERPKKGEA